MKFEVTVLDGAGYVLVKVFGPVTRAAAMEMVGIVARRRQEADLGRCLYDARESVNAESTLGSFLFLNTDLPSAAITPGARVALLVAPDDHSYDFIETVAMNRGHLVRLFREEASAIRWLTA
jgi:hypothetical protein